MVTYSLHKYTYSIMGWVPFRLAKELKQICRLRSNYFCTLIVNLSFDTKHLSRNTSVPEIFDVAHIFVRSPPFSLKCFSHKTTFEEIFLNNVVAYA